MHPIIEIKTIMYMRAIAREGSFQSAAEALYTSQPYRNTSRGSRMS